MTSLYFKAAKNFNPDPQLNHFYGYDPSSLLEALAAGEVLNLTELEQAVSEIPGEAAGFFMVIGRLLQQQAIAFTNNQENSATLRPIVESLVLPEKEIDPHGHYRLSRFTSIRPERGEILIEHPLSGWQLVVDDPSLLPLIMKYSKAGAASTDTAELDVLQLLFIAGMLVACDQEGNAEEDQSLLARWEPHDLMFHRRSRAGFHDYPLGATYRFGEDDDQVPAIKDNPWRQNSVNLPEPQVGPWTLPVADLDQVIVRRESIRQYSPVAMTLQQLSDFLHRSVRIQASGRIPDSRPYAGGGGLWEQEIYLLIDRCFGISPGYYYYDPAAHVLSLVAAPNADTESLMSDYHAATGSPHRTPVGITIASRFPRVASKYESMAYALQLKNCGVLMAHFYLIATGMALAPCAIGSGNSETFARLTGIDPLEEGPVGEFALGR